MKNAILAVLIAGTLASRILAEEITTLKGKTYSNVLVQRVDPDGITIKHSAGVGKIFFAELPVEIRTKYGYDVEKHRQYYNGQRKQLAQKQLIRSMDSSAIEVEARLSQILDDGSLAYIKERRTYVFTNLVSDTSSGTTDYVSPLTGYRRTMPSGSQGSIVREKISSYTSEIEREEPVFISGLGGGHVDGDIWYGKIYPIGIYSYTTVQGAPKKIEEFTVSRETALRYFGN